jgi:hypothetical protein
LVGSIPAADTEGVNHHLKERNSMSTQTISSTSLICAERSQRAATLSGRPRAATKGDGTEFLEGMLVAGRQTLAAGRLLALPARNATLVCVEGEVWLTRDGDREDYILGAGSSLHLGQRDQAMVQALKASRLRLILA